MTADLAKFIKLEDSRAFDQQPRRHASGGELGLVLLSLYVTHLSASLNQFCRSARLVVSMAFRTFSLACKAMD